MRKLIARTVLAAGVAACATTPVPHDRMVAAQASYRGAQEAGAEGDPQARLHLKLADEEMDQARKLIEQKKNGDAALLLDQAKADAELAIGLAREAKVEAEAQQAVARVRALQAGNQ